MILFPNLEYSDFLYYNYIIIQCVEFFLFKLIILLFCKQCRLRSGETREVAMANARQRTRDLLGGRIATIASGGALIGEEMVKFVEDCFGAQVRDSYGSTESGGISVGGAIVEKDAKWKLIDCPQLGYLTTDRPNPRGELCIQSPLMFRFVQVQVCNVVGV